MSMAPLPAGVKRDCTCPKARHVHGTAAAYNGDRCRCLACRAAAAAEYRRRYRLKAYGRFQPRHVPSTGTMRRVHALMTLGWPITLQAEMIGLQRTQLVRAVREQTPILASTAAKVSDLYDELWDRPRTGRGRAENVSIAMTRARAARAGYAPPLAWSEETIDDPEALPDFGDTSIEVVDDLAVEEAITGRAVTLTPAEFAEAVNRMTGRGFSAREIAHRLRTTERSVQRSRAVFRAVRGDQETAA